jgi:hypothetical protein
MALFVHAKIRVPLGGVSLYLLKTALVQQASDAFAGGELSFGVLSFNPPWAAALLDFLPLRV